MDTYASHLPVLQALGRFFPIYRVLELGAGQYSTPCFIDKTYYPDLRLLISFEDDRGWWASIREIVMHDPRAVVMFADDMLETLERQHFDEYDLIFIDNGYTQEERVRVIQYVTQQLPDALIVIHDYQEPVYKVACADGYCDLEVSNTFPYTGILSRKAERLQRLARENPQWLVSSSP